MTKEFTYVAREITAVNSMMATDLACKRVLASREIASRILVHAVSEYKGHTPEEVAEHFILDSSVDIGKEIFPGFTNRQSAGSIQTGSEIPNEASVYFDVTLKALLPDEKRTKTQMYLHADIEAQKAYFPGYPIEKRAFYYIARLISSQLEAIAHPSDYANLQKVYGIWICLGKDIPKKEQQTITRYYVTREDVVGASRDIRANYDVMELIVIRLGDKEPPNEFLGMLKTLLWDELPVHERMERLEKAYRIPMTEETKREVENMCTYSYAIKERAEEQGWKRGRKEGQKEGEERISRLYAFLLEQKRYGDLERAAENPTFRRELLAEYGL